MFIIFNVSDLIEFFNKEPVTIGDKEEGKYIFVSKDEYGFSLNLTIDTYAQDILLTVLYKNNIIFRSEFQNVISIEKNEKGKEMHIYTETHRIVVKREKLFGVILEEI